MGYFSNGEEGMAYQDTYCMNCRNWQDHADDRGEGCPVWDLHYLWNYEATGKNKQTDKEMALSMFIPRDGIWNSQCAMFLKK
jgi:hypothetical protein